MLMYAYFSNYLFQKQATHCDAPSQYPPKNLLILNCCAPLPIYVTFDMIGKGNQNKNGYISTHIGG